jgi:methyl-accepting chemotaxis protein
VIEGNIEALKVEIDHMKDDIKEIKQESKENAKYFREVINALKDNFDTLKENSIVQTEILKNQERQFAQVNNDIEELDAKFDNNMQMQTKWYQTFLSDLSGKTIKILFIIVLILAGAKFVGLDITKLLTGL